MLRHITALIILFTPVFLPAQTGKDAAIYKSSHLNLDWVKSISSIILDENGKGVALQQDQKTKFSHPVVIATFGGSLNSIHKVPSGFDVLFESLARTTIFQDYLARDRNNFGSLDIVKVNLEIEKEEAVAKILKYGIIIFVVIFLAFSLLFIKNQRTTTLLKKQKEQIERQQKDIASKNDQLIDRNAKLMTINDEKTNLVQILAHDLRSPLNQIIGLADVLKILRPDAGDEELGYIAQVSDSAKRLSSMVSKILNAETLDEGQEIIQIEEVDVNDIFEDISDRYVEIAEEKGIQLQATQYMEDNSVIETDHLLLLLVLENLVSNAVKFSSADTLVQLLCERNENEVLFKVVDQGPGFSEEDKKMMFGRFQRLSAQPTGGEPSTGLGLSIVKRYITDLGGSIWIESEVGQGTTFFISLKSND